MNTKNLVLTLLLCLLLIGLAGVLLTAQASDNQAASKTATSEETVELTWSFEVRIRLPILKKDAD